MTTATNTPNRYGMNMTAHKDLSEDTDDRLKNLGLAMIPRRPTPRMVEAGRLAGNGDPAMATAIFAAMMDAAE